MYGEASPARYSDKHERRTLTKEDPEKNNDRRGISIPLSLIYSKPPLERSEMHRDLPSDG